MQFRRSGGGAVKERQRSSARNSFRYDKLLIRHPPPREANNAWVFVFSALVGGFFGYYAARKAALLNPIEALRYE